MDSQGESTGQTRLTQAGILYRIIAKSIDVVIIGIFLELIPRVGFFAGLIYLLICDGLFDGRSAGKRLIGLKVIISATGKACGFKGSIMRNFPLAVGYVLMGIPLIGFVFPLIIVAFEGLIMIGNEQNLRLGDEVAGTQVIETETGEQERADTDSDHIDS